MLRVLISVTGANLLLMTGMCWWV